MHWRWMPRCDQDVTLWLFRIDNCLRAIQRLECEHYEWISITHQVPKNLGFEFFKVPQSCNSSDIKLASGAPEDVKEVVLGLETN